MKKLSDSVSKEPSPWPTKKERVLGRSKKKQAVLMAAVRMFNERGFRATSLEDVATSLGVTKPTIYYYFKNKDEILLDCFRKGLDRVLAAAEQSTTKNDSGLRCLRALIYAQVMTVTSEFGKCASQTSENDLSVESRLLVRKARREIDLVVQGVIEMGVKDGSIAVSNSKMAAYMIEGTLNSISSWYNPDGKLTRETIAEYFADMLLDGVAK